MNFNKIIVQNIFETSMRSALVREVGADLRSLSEYDYLFESMDETISSVALSYIDTIMVDDLQTKTNEKGTAVSGTIRLMVEVTMYAISTNNKEHPAYNDMMELYYNFSFNEENGIFKNLKLEWLDDPGEPWV